MLASCLLWSDSAEFQSWAPRRCSTCFSCCRHRACCFAKTSGVPIQVPTKLACSKSQSTLRLVRVECAENANPKITHRRSNKHILRKLLVARPSDCAIFFSKELFVVLGPFFERQFGDLQNCCACFWKTAQAVVLALAARLWNKHMSHAQKLWVIPSSLDRDSFVKHVA